MAKAPNTIDVTAQVHFQGTPFDKVLQELKEMHDRKSKDYGVDENPFRNFDQVANMHGITPLEFCNIMVTLKQARIANLKGKMAVNESLEDSLIDRAVYAVIAVVLYRRDNP
jgi:hypothetical protein